MSFDVTYKQLFAIHSHRVQDSSNSLMTDGTYLTHIKQFFDESTEKSQNNSKYWNDPYHVSKHYKYCRHKYDMKEEQSKENMEYHENLCVKMNNKTSLNFMATNLNDMMFFNITKDLGLHENWQC